MQKIEVFKKNIFDQIISDLYKKYDIKDEIEFKSFLSEHKLIMENLAKNIRSRGRVDIDYKKHKIQVSYVLRYFHVYWYQIYHALKKISELEVNFFKDSDKALKLDYLEQVLLLKLSGLQILYRIIVDSLLKSLEDL